MHLKFIRTKATLTVDCNCSFRTEIVTRASLAHGAHNSGRLSRNQGVNNLSSDQNASSIIAAI
jgi:hypothetical protein